VLDGFDTIIERTSRCHDVVGLDVSIREAFNRRREFSNAGGVPLRDSWKQSGWIVIGGAGLAGMALLAYLAMKPDLGPPPRAIAEDALLVKGRTLYLTRCASCHGPLGRGDGPVSKGLAGPKPRDFVADKWKHGDEAERVLAVVADGVKDTGMAGWKNVYSPQEIRAVSAYVYHLAGKPVPASLRVE
jgi:cytochrome c oxidase cbb3-type subunit III